MDDAAEEERQLRIAALRNVEEILVIRRRAEEELRAAKEALEKKNEELQQQREWFQVTLSSIGDAVITTDARANVTFMNPIAEAMTGWMSAQALGKPLGEVFHIINEYTRVPVEHPVDKVLREERIVALANHTALMRRDGTLTAIEDSAAPIRDLKGNLTGAVMVFHDVTARRQAEIALRDSEDRFRTIFNHAAVGIGVVDLEGHFVQTNERLARILGYPLQELKGVSLVELTHPQDREAAQQGVQRLLAQEISSCALQCRYLRRDGAVIWALSTVTLLRDALGQPLYFVGIVEDVTGRKQAEEAQARLAAVVASSDDAILSITLEGVVTTWNRAAERTFGYSEAQMIGRYTTDLIPPDRIDEEPAILDRIRHGERIDQYETVRRRKDGSLMDVSIAVSPIMDELGRIVGASKIARDITQSRRTAAALQEADRRKDEFLATLAHELRNPLAPIRQAAQIFNAAAATEAQKRWSQQVISRQVQHMSLLLDDLLDVSRITRGTLELRLESTDLAEVIEAAVETARPSIDAKRHEFSVHQPRAAIRVVADPLRLAQILSNLLTNAAKYTDPQGCIQLCVDTTAEGVVLTVRDSGIGIAADSIAGMFQMFGQVKAAQDRSEGGLGIGLALAKGLVELHGGRIEARSAGAGEGSEFVVFLPWRNLPPPRQSAAEVPADTTPVKRRILIADDNRDAAESLAMLLQLEGHEVRVVYDGHAALAAIGEFQPEVALLDIGMPGLNGYEVALTLRRASPELPVILIALTGWGQGRDKERALAAGFNHHFTKPVEPERLKRLLR